MPSPSIRVLRVHLGRRPNGDAIDILRRSVAPGVRITGAPDEPPPDTEVLVDGRPTAEVLRRCSQLRAIVVPYAGLHAATRQLLLEQAPTLEIYNLHHNAAAAAELALALLLAAAKTLLPADRAFRSGDWRSRYDGAPMLILEGKTAVILGLGAIGARVATSCRALGMAVHAVRRHPQRSHPPGIAVHSPETLPGLLPTADVLLICLPLTPATEGLIGKRELAALPSSSVLVNVARGAIVDERALYDALKEGRIAAAGLDVWYRYPGSPEEREATPPSRFPFADLDQVVMSPHRGGAFGSLELERRRMTDLAAVLNRLQRSERFSGQVDLQAGY